MTAGLPPIVPRRDRSHSLPMRPFCRTARLVHRGFSMMDGSVRGSYDINYAKSGSQCYGARGRPGFGGSTCR
jgi:hypothetical protein